MLVLTRKRGELIQIDGNIQVTVISVQGNRVRLGIEAPDSVSVRRGELVFELEAEATPRPEEPVCV
jgi:carbon storage regulator